MHALAERLAGILKEWLHAHIVVHQQHANRNTREGNAIAEDLSALESSLLHQDSVCSQKPLLHNLQENSVRHIDHLH